MRRPLRRRVPTVRLLLVAAALMGIALSTTTGGRADAQTGSTTSPGAPRLTLMRQTDWVGPDGVFEVAFKATGLPTGATVGGLLSPRVRSRATLDAVASGESPGDPIFIVPAKPVAELTGPDEAVVVKLPVTTGSATAAGTALLSAPGVYPFDIQVFDADKKVVADLVTSLLRLGEADPSSSSSTLGVGVVVPIVADVVPGLDNSPTLDDAGAERLAGTIAAIAARPDVPMTLTPSAESLFLLKEREIAGGATPGSTTVDRLPTGAGRQVLTGPYAPIDTGSWIDSGLVGEMDDQYAQGTITLTALLQSQPDEKAAVLDRTVSPAALDHLRTLGVETVVAPSDQLTRLADPIANANFAQRFDIATSDGNTVRAVVGDSPTAARLGRVEDPVLAGHQALAELACLSLPQCGAQSGGTGQRGVAVSVPAATDPTALNTFLNGLADRDGAGSHSTGEPLVTPQTLDQLVATTAVATGRNRIRGYETDAPTDLGRYPSDLRSARVSFTGLKSLVPGTPALTAPVDRTLLSSGARNLDADQREATVGAAQNQIGAVTGQIVVTPEQIVTLTSSSGKVPLNLENRLQVPASVRIVLNSAKLDFPEGSVIEETLAPAQTTTIDLPVETRASGAFPLNVAISSADGTLPVATTRYTVRSTAISGVGLVLSIGAGLFLLIWWARHFRTARRARKLVGSTHPTLSGTHPDGYAPPDTDPMEGR